MKRFRLRVLTIAHDVVWVPVAIVVAFWVHYDLHWIPQSAFDSVLALVYIAVPLHAITFWATGCYRVFWRYASITDLVRFLLAVGIGGVMTIAYFLSTLASVVQPPAVLLLYPIFLFLGVIGTRVLFRLVVEQREAEVSHDRDSVLVVGAGKAGNLLIRDLLARGHYHPVGILDDNPTMMGSELHGVRVIGKISDLTYLAMQDEIKAVLVAIPSAPTEVLSRIVDDCAELGIVCRTLPSLAELAMGRGVREANLRAVTVEDLLGRTPVHFDDASVMPFIEGKVVMVTGGGGSIGSELCRQIARFHPRKIVVFESSEHALYRIANELNALLGPEQVAARLGDCKHGKAVNRVMREIRPDIIFHSAAYKHVPLVEENIIEGIANNVLGTMVVADLAVKYRVESMVLISTDKTVNPTNYMGASKRVAEIYCQSMNREGGTHFITTRFGNVLASAGSVVPLFQEQIARGGPVTVTHPEIERFFMTIPEAVSLILQAGAMGKGGEIFVLEMGKPVKIRDLAKKMIRLSGLQPDRDIKIEYTGLRPGEKLSEELFYASESLRRTDNPLLMLANSVPMDPERLGRILHRLELAMRAGELDDVHALMLELVPSFSASPPMPQSGTSRHYLRIVN